MNFNTVTLMIATGWLAAAANAGGDCLQWVVGSPPEAAPQAAPVAVYDSLRGVCVLVSADFQTFETHQWRMVVRAGSADVLRELGALVAADVRVRQQ